METSKKTAIITGASSGLGKELLNVIVGKENIEEIWIIARRAERLEEIKAAFPDKNIFPLALDLTSDDDLNAFAKALSEKSPDVVYLFNNAGMGKLGNIASSDRASQVAAVDLNCRALTAVTVMVLPYMKKGAGIVNTCSIASFAPNPGMTVYSSTKAYVMSFSRGLRFELKKSGINVLAVCPGPMRTEFLPLAGIEKGSSHTFDTLPYCDPVKVAKGAVKASDKRRAVYTPRFFFKFYRLVSKLLPHSLVMHLSKT